MKNVLKITLYSLSSLYLVLGLLALINPGSEIFLQKFGVIADPNYLAHGSNSLRAVFGGMLFASGFMIILGLRTKNRTWLDAVTLSLSFIILGRVIAIFADGFDPLILPGLLGEVVLAPLLFIAPKKLNF
jgi:hypothetical protein